ncbi:PH domain-containing protein [Desulfovibrio inopinatus]|uniref:PH domain-containing protein n=1 Tax=Desulfovibrio inopinatus TaxID=102109 RepID=UPI000426131E|nr:PH domain-containing protein [Desulfovibrio inopinatus]
METHIFQIAPSAARTWWVYVVMGSAAVLIIAAFFFVQYMVKSALRASFEVSQNELVIHGGFYGRSIPLRDLILDEALKITMGKDAPVRIRAKRNGVSMSGLKSGWFSLSTPQGRQKGLLFLTDATRAVYIPTRQGYALLLSPEDPAGFLAALH